MLEKRELSYTISGNVNGCSYATVENSMEVPQKTENRITIWYSNLTPGHITRQNYDSKRYMHSYVYGCMILRSQDMEAT